MASQKTAKKQLGHPVQVQTSEVSSRYRTGISAALFLALGTALCLPAVMPVAHAHDRSENSRFRASDGAQAVSAVSAERRFGPSASWAEAIKSPNPTWSPSCCDRLARLPIAQLKSSVDQDFSRSALATAIRALNSQISQRRANLEEMRNVAERAEGEYRLEQRRQLLIERQALIGLMGERLGLLKQELSTRAGIFTELLGRVEDEARLRDHPMAESGVDLTAARKRLENNAQTAEPRAGSENQADHRKRYAENRESIERMEATLADHPQIRTSGQKTEISGRRTHLIGLLEDVENSLALLHQEETILNHLSKLVALDAIALDKKTAEREVHTETGIAHGVRDLTVSAMTDLFVDKAEEQTSPVDDATGHAEPEPAR